MLEEEEEKEEEEGKKFEALFKASDDVERV